MLIPHNLMALVHLILKNHKTYYNCNFVLSLTKNVKYIIAHQFSYLVLKIFEESSFYFRIRNEAVSSCAKIFVYLLSSFWSFCCGVLGWISHPARSCPWKNGHAYHSLPCAYQHFQYCHHKLSQCGGNDCHWCLDARLYLLCVWSPGGLCLPAVEEEEKLPKKEKEQETNR